MPKPEIPTSTMATRSKKEKITNDPKQLSSEVKNEMKTKAIVEKGVADLPIEQKIQSVKETAKIDIKIEKKIDQSIEKKIEPKSLIEECSILEKSKVEKEPPSSSEKDEFSILERNKPKKEELSTLMKNESVNIVTSIPKEKELSPPKKDESTSLEKNKPKETELSPPKKDESISLEKNKPKESKLFFIDTNKPTTPSNVAVPRKSQPYVPPISNQPPIVLATHLVPSLPIGLFEVLAEMIEVATERPVVLLYEPRTNRKVASEYTDIAILPAGDDWGHGELMPLSFVFQHKLNNNNSPQVYADVVVASDLVHRIEKIVDLRGHRCALPDRSKKIGAATLIYNYLHSIGEGPAFFGNTLDVDSQLDAMQMVAGKQAEVGVLAAPVITCHKYNFPGIQSLYIVDSLGPLPPYRFMVNKKISEAFVKKLTSYLLNCNEDASWMMKLAPFGITGFATNTQDYYVFSDIKPVFSRGAYY